MTVDPLIRFGVARRSHCATRLRAASPAGMSEGIEIGVATAADAAQIAAIYAHHVANGVATFELAPPSAAETAGRIAKVRGAGHPWLVAREAGRAVGYAYAAPFHARPAYAFTCEDSIYLAHDRLGRGIGSSLLGALLPAAEAAGFRQMIALIAGDEAASLALHRRFGFAEAGRMRSVGRKHGRWLDVITLQCALGPGDGAAPEKEP